MAVDLQIKILLVEDSSIMRKMELKILNDLGFNNIVEAVDGEDAIDKLQAQGQINLIISDWNMPKKSGFELLEWVRAQDQTRQIPFIMATGEADKKEAARALAAGVSSLVAKPFTPDELKQKIEACFEEPSTQKQTPTKIKRQATIVNGKVSLKIAHIQITDHLALGVLKNLIDTGQLSPQHFTLEPMCLPGWNPVQEKLEKGEIDGAFVLAPIAMDLFGYGVPIRLVLLAHKNGSIFVRSKKAGVYESDKKFYKNKTFYIPHKMSVHNMLAHKFFSEIGLKPGVPGKEGSDVFFEVVPPIKMPDFLASNPEAGGFMVAEPIGTKAIAGGIAELQFLSSQLWNHHPCCVVTLQEDIVSHHGEAVFELTSMLVKAGQFIAEKPNIAAEIAVAFLDPQKNLGLKVPVLKNVLTEPQGIQTDDLFPIIEDFERMQRYMVEVMGFGNLVDLEKFIDLRFAEVACKDSEVLKRKSTQVTAASRQASTLPPTSKEMLEKEGKYLTFALGKVEYGVGILKVREIIGMLPITAIPQTVPYIKGVINLRGKVIPVIDLREKFGLTQIEYNERTCIIVLEIAGSLSTILTGIVVDAVSEVMNIKAENIENRPAFGAKLDMSFILGMAKMEGGVKILLDIDRALRSEDVGIFAETWGSA
jgi:chemotaxis signal transduction protein/CheY-like chemotaxis protein/ABC-type nitrate/sulfonate/bicarbonate transport system substrate-binding protein